MLTQAKLEELLRANCIPFDTWGAGSTKTIDHLLGEIRFKETSLRKIEGLLTREVSTAAINVYRVTPQKTLLLKEQKQVFKDGRSRKRILDTSIAEKIKSGENSRAAAQRAFTEELGISEFVTLVFKERRTKGPKPSLSYPGLQTINTLHYFDAFLSERAFKRGGYLERQPDKSTYFIWEEVPHKKART